MHPSRFDALAKSLTLSVSRRAAFGGLMAGLVAPLLHDPAAAKRRKRRGGERHTDRDLNRADNAAVGIEKKKKKKKKKNPAPCAAACTGKPPCADDGCGSPCETCAGGRGCQGGQCACPADKPVGGICGSGGDECRECCTGGECLGDQLCDHTQGSICRCPDGLHFCNNICWSCCTTEHCVGTRHFGDGFFCDRLNRCICPEGLTECLKPDATGNYCSNVKTDEFNCGRCGAPCLGGTCVDGVCTPPEGPQRRATSG